MRYCKIFFIFLLCLFSKNLIALEIKNIDHFIQLDNSKKIFVKEKYIDIKKQKIEIKHSKVIVLLPPLSIPSAEAFDISNLSFMNEFAKKGFDVWAIDFEGQGRSDYPKSMQENPAPKGIFPVQQSDALQQLKVVIDYIKKQKSIDSVSLLGWSWGSVVAANYSTLYSSDIHDLILVGAMYSFRLPKFAKPFLNKEDKFNTDLSAYQLVPWEAIDSHWKMMEQNKNLVLDKDKEEVKKVYEQLDKNTFIKGSLRRAMGPMKDLVSIWSNKPVYDISKVTSNTLVIYGDQDLFADKNLFHKLIHCKNKKEVVIKNATHWVFYEKNRTQLNKEILNFLNNRNIQ
jgi:pimeloyl-ACP methyl ester carboxylesterase